MVYRKRAETGRDGTLGKEAKRWAAAAEATAPEEAYVGLEVTKAGPGSSLGSGAWWNLPF